MTIELTIGMACFDDSDRAKFTIESLLAHHGEVMPQCEIFVCDNHPGSPSSESLIRTLDSVRAGGRVAAATYHVYPMPGTDYPKQEILLRAQGKYVLVVDSHVLLPTGVVAGLLQFFRENPETSDLYHGPILTDSQSAYWDHFTDVWSGKMWGQWGTDPRGADPTSWTPYEIQAQGTGLFACRKEAWVPFPRGLRGFGGAEWCMHENWRKHGRKVMCLPALRWWHWFRDQVTPTPYPNDMIDRLINYLIWFQHLGRDDPRLKNHFVAEGVVSAAQFDEIAKDPLAYTAKRSGGCGSCGKAKEVVVEDLAALAKEAAARPADLNEHVPTFLHLAQTCQTALEVATRPQSTIALVSAGLKRVVSINSAASDGMMAALVRLNRGTDLLLTNTPWPNVPAEDVDLLFLDERHTADAVYAQLAHFGPQCKRFIVLHDTVLFGEQGEDGGAGILPAVRRWMREYPQWSVLSHTAIQHGLTVLGCNPEDKPSLPSLPRMAWNYAKAIAGHIASGAALASQDEIDRRLEICQMCPQRVDGNRCAVCGCFLDEGPDGREGKALWSESECPLGKWGPPQ